MACGFLNKFKFSKKLKKFLLHILLGPDVNAVTDPDYADEVTGQEQSLPVMKERIPDLSLPMMKHE